MESFLMYSKVKYQIQINRELTGTDNEVSVVLRTGKIKP